MDRVILHVDMNNFYASVSCLSHPELEGQPVAVCGDVEKRHGIVLAKNNIAKARGVKTASTVREIASYGGDTTAFVTPAVQRHLGKAVRK